MQPENEIWPVKDTHRGKTSSNKLKRLQKVSRWATVLLVHQINSLQVVIKVNQNFRKK